MAIPINVLIAYPYFKKPILDFMKTMPHNTYRLVVDSGAFTAWNCGKVIKLDEYCKFLDSIECLQPFKAVQLDVFGDPEQTWKNFLIMQKRGYDVMPVFTRGDTLERLEEMYSFTDYIMFGGIVTGDKNMNYVKWFMEQNKGRKVHWLGFCNIDFIKHYKPTSVDSSSWSSGARFGNIPFYAGHGRANVLNRQALLTMPSEKIFELAQRSGVTRDELALLRHNECWTAAWTSDRPITDKIVLDRPVKGIVNFLSAIFSTHRALDVEKNLGTRFYLACGMGASHVSVAFRAREFLIQRGVLKDGTDPEQRTRPEIIRRKQNEVSRAI